MFHLKLVLTYYIVFHGDKFNSLISVGTFPVMMNKLTEKAIIELAVSAPVCRTGCAKTMEYGNTLFREIASDIGVIFPDAVCFFSCLVRNGRICKEGNFLHLYRVLSRVFYRIYPKKQILRQILKQYTVF